MAHAPVPQPAQPAPGTPACPRCGSYSYRTGGMPWYLGTIGAFVCRPVICNQCQHEFDYRSPKSDLGSRKLKLALLINGIGALGILTVIGLLIWVVVATSRPY